MADKRVLQIFDELKELHIAKDSDYGGNEPLGNFKRCEVFGIPAWKGCLVRMSDKWSRLLSLVAKGGEHAVGGEGIEDTLKDLAVYSIITMALMLRQEPKTTPSVDEQVIRHTHVPSCDGWTSNVAFPEAVSTQDDIKALWAERERVAAGDGGIT